MLSFPSSSLSRERLATGADERRNSRRFTLVTLGVDLGDRLEIVGAVEGTTGTAMLGGGG